MLILLSLVDMQSSLLKLDCGSIITSCFILSIDIPVLPPITLPAASLSICQVKCTGAYYYIRQCLPVNSFKI